MIAYSNTEKSAVSFAQKLSGRLEILSSLLQQQENQENDTLVPIQEDLLRPWPKGLSNPPTRNLCFRNVILQMFAVMFATHPDIKHLLSSIENFTRSDEPLKEPEVLVAVEMSRLILQMFDNQSSETLSVDHLNIATTAHTNNFPDYTQQDAQEYLTYLIDCIEKASGRPLSALSGRTATHLHWPCCERNTINDADTNQILQLPITSDTLHGCIENFGKKEQVGDDKGVECEKCAKRRTFPISRSEYTPPGVAIVQLKRYDQAGRKRLDHVEFPLVGLKFPDCNDVYDLIGVVNQEHPEEDETLSLDSGHYTAYAKYDGQWFMYDDKHCTPITTRIVCNPNAYILFYRRRDTEEVERPIVSTCVIHMHYVSIELILTHLLVIPSY